MQRTPFDVPDQMRQAADKSVEQAKKAFENFMEATQEAVAKAEGTAKSIRDSAADAGRQAMAFVEENIAASFDLAQNLVRARTVEEVAALQQEFLRRQMASAAEQGKNFGSMASRAANDAMDKVTPKGKK
jgi:phasin